MGPTEIWKRGLFQLSPTWRIVPIWSKAMWQLFCFCYYWLSISLPTMSTDVWWQMTNSCNAMLFYMWGYWTPPALHVNYIDIKPTIHNLSSQITYWFSNIKWFTLSPFNIQFMIGFEFDPLGLWPRFLLSYIYQKVDRLRWSIESVASSFKLKT